MTASTLKNILMIDRLYPGTLPHLIMIYKIGKADGKLEYSYKEISQLKEKIYGITAKIS